MIIPLSGSPVMEFAFRPLSRSPKVYQVAREMVGAAFDAEPADDDGGEDEGNGAAPSGALRRLAARGGRAGRGRCASWSGLHAGEEEAGGVADGDEGQSFSGMMWR